jgi:2'-5' RNA ligase
VVHSVELLFDDTTDAAVRALWDGIAAAGVPSQAGHRSPTNRPHITVTVTEDLDAAADEALRGVLDRLPMTLVLGAPMLFGGGRTVTLVRSVVPTDELLDLHAEVHLRCLPYVRGEVLSHAEPGQWTPHVTLARRLTRDQIPAALAASGAFDDIAALATGLRHWDGDNRVEHPLG